MLFVTSLHKTMKKNMLAVSSWSLIFVYKCLKGSVIESAQLKIVANSL